MPALPTTHHNRIMFFDNIRYLMVLLVVVLHMACSYSHYTQWWAVNDDNSAVFDYLLRLLGIFLMPTLFFIAGYFTLPSLRRWGTWRFIKGKIYRLGIPWLIGVILLGPVRTYIYEYSRGFQEIDLWKLLVINMSSAISLHTGYINSVYQFNHIHFWFISLLLLFFIFFALLHHGKNRLSAAARPTRASKPHSNSSIWAIVFLVSVFTTVWTLFMHSIFTKVPGQEPWVIIAGVIQFQPTRVGLYIICFSLGIFSYHKQWFSDSKTPVHIIFGALLCVALWFTKEMVLAELIKNFTLTMAVIHVALRAFLVFSIIVTLISLGGRCWQSSSGINRTLSENAYTIYLIHMVFVFLLQLLMYEWWDVSIFIKFLVGCAFSLLLTYAVSEYAVRRYPRSCVAAMVLGFALLVLFLRPAIA